MNVEEAIVNVHNVQNAFATIATLLQLTSYLYPPSVDVEDGATYDYIVVGAGTAGSVVANRLTEDPNVSVLLIEAGGDPPIQSNLPAIWSYNLNTSLDWNYKSQIDKEAFQCHKNNQLYISQGKVLGGTSSISSLHYVRGDPKDYNTWSAITGDPSWNYTSVLPYFKKSERFEDSSVLNSPYGKFHGTHGYMGITISNHSRAKHYLDSIKEIGYNVVLDTNGDNTVGFTEHFVHIADDIRQSTANTYLSSIKERPNLHIMKNSMVTKIIIDENKTAKGVVVSGDTKQTISAEVKKEVIVSAGAINTPRLLMLSGVGPKDKLNELDISVVVDLPVGIKVQDQKMVSIFFKMDKSSSDFEPFNPHKFPTSGVSGFVALNSSQKFPDYQTVLLDLGAEQIVSLCSTEERLNNAVCQYLYEETKGKDAMWILVNNFSPKSRGHVSLKSKDPEHAPEIYMHSFPDDDDVENYVSFIEDIIRLVNTSYFKNLRAEVVKLPKCQEFEDGSKDYWRCYMGCLSTTGYHYVGTCPMGTVVDSRLRVLGVKNLRVVDASVMPTIISGNPMMPTVMIGEKAADMIKADNE